MSRSSYASMMSFGSHGARSRPVLTPRERQIVERIALGQDDKEIAAGLETSQSNVASRIARLFLKFGVHRRAALVWVALAEAHLGPPGTGASEG